MNETLGNSTPNSTENSSFAVDDLLSTADYKVDWADSSPNGYEFLPDDVLDVDIPDTNTSPNAPHRTTPNVPDAQKQSNPNAPSPDNKNQSDAAYQAEKSKWVNGGRAKMVHWYKAHPEEISDIMFVGAEHDEVWYQKNPDGIGDLVRDRLRQERALAAELAADSNNIAIDPKATLELARRELSKEYQSYLEKEAAMKKRLEAKDKQDIESGDKSDVENSSENGNTELTDEQKALLEEEARNNAELAKVMDEIIALENAGKDVDLDKIDQDLKRDEQEAERLEKLIKDRDYFKRELDSWRDKLAESYAKNRRLIVGNKNRLDYAKYQERYQTNLERYLRTQAEIAELKQRSKLNLTIEHEYDALEQKKAAGEITAEEANKAIFDKWDELNQSAKSAVSAKFVECYLEEQNALEKTTIDRIDNGNFYRKAVSKVLNNPKFKVALAAAGVAGLAVTGYGLATGALALGYHLTAGGISLGAGKGALSATIMSRQDSRNSAVRNFLGSEEEIRKQLENIDTSKDENIANVTNWLVKQYDKAKEADNKSNHRRTLISMGLGALIGGATSGIQFNKTIHEEVTTQEITGYEPTKIKATNINKVNHAEGTGTQQLFRELGGDGETYYSSDAHDVMIKVLEKYGITVGENDWTYPGKISEWPDTARVAFKAVAREWAKRGLVPATETGGEPIYTPVTETVTRVIQDKFAHIFKDIAANVTAGLAGNVVSNRTNRITTPESLQLY